MGRVLTPKTNLTTLRKDAKRWLKALRADDAKARARLLKAWPKAPAAPGLRDVQHALALDYGCESWIALKAAIEDLGLDRHSHDERIERLLRHGWDGDVVVARRIVQKYPDIARDSLFTAAVCGDLAEVERRLVRDPEAATRVGGSMNWTALAYVTYSRIDTSHAVAIAQRLIAAGADPNFQFDDGWGSPFKVLTGAVRLGEGARPSHAQVSELLELLIEAGAAPYDLQALYNVSIVGSDTDWYDRFWTLCETAGVLDMWRIAGEGRLGAWKQLSTLDYLLGNAVGQNHLISAEWLLARGAKANALNAYTGQPVHAMAQLSGFADMARLLESHGASPPRLTGIGAFQAACMCLDQAEARALVTARPALVQHPGPLLAAAELGYAPVVDLLLSLGAPVAGLDHQGISPLHRAVQSGSLETVDRLVKAGAEIDLRERCWQGTPLSWSGVLKQPHLTNYLAPLSRDVRALAYLGLQDRLEALLGAEPGLANHVLDNQDTPTPLFCLPDDEDSAATVARILIRFGADATRRNDKGQTAVEVARVKGLDDAADVMEGLDHA